jgi:hypothetical protein
MYEESALSSAHAEQDEIHESTVTLGQQKNEHYVTSMSLATLSVYIPCSSLPPQV